MASRLALPLVLLLATWLAIVVESGPVIMRDENELESGDEEEIDLSHLGLDIYGEPDESVGERVAQYNPETDLVNPEELGTYVDGDILITRPGGRNGLADKSTRWPGGVVPFVISGNFQAKEMQMIEDAFNQYHTKTCVRFKPRMGEKDYISIESSNSGCWSSVGRTGGRQEVNLQMPGCTTKVGTIVHELMHAVGFLHEQNRYERDDWVSIQTQNIQRGTETNFVKAKSGTTDAFGVQYDYGSVMHYSATAFSSNGAPTIIAKKTGGNKMGQRNGFSQGDINKINAMYGCSKGASTGTATTVSKPQRPSRPVKPAANGNKPTGAQIVGFIGNLIGAALGDNETYPLSGTAMGQREGFSRSDVEKINRMYHCGGETTGSGPSISLPFPVPSPPFVPNSGYYPYPYPNPYPYPPSGVVPQTYPHPGGSYPQGPYGPYPQDETPNGLINSVQNNL